MSNFVKIVWQIKEKVIEIGLFVWLSKRYSGPISTIPINALQLGETEEIAGVYTDG